MKLRLAELPQSDKETPKIRTKGLNKSYRKIEKVIYYQELSFVLEIVQIQLITWYYYNLLAYYFGINKNKRLIR